MHRQFLHPEVLFLNDPFLYTASSKKNTKNYKKITKKLQKHYKSYKKNSKIIIFYWKIYGEPRSPGGSEWK